jgi:hypothetical protein
MASRHAPRTLKEGWLSKKGKLRKAWKRRYFKLTPLLLSYYDSGYAKQPKGAVELSHVLDVCRSENPMVPEFTLDVVTKGRVYCMCAHGIQDMQEWIQTLREAVERQAATDGVASPLKGAVGQGRYPKGTVHSHLNNDGSAMSLGWMLKKGALHKTFQRRFFRCTRQSLSYYRSETDMVCAGTIDLGAVVKLRKSHDANFSLQLETPVRTWVLCPESERSLVEWARVRGGVCGWPWDGEEVGKRERERVRMDVCRHCICCWTTCR